MFANFNSIKVQLEPIEGVNMAQKGLNFNSIKVQLEPALSSAAGGASAFQFHKGTIRTTSFHKGVFTQSFISIP